MMQPQEEFSQKKHFTPYFELSHLVVMILTRAGERVKPAFQTAPKSSCDWRPFHQRVQREVQSFRASGESSDSDTISGFGFSFKHRGRRKVFILLTPHNSHKSASRVSKQILCRCCLFVLGCLFSFFASFV